MSYVVRWIGLLLALPVLPLAYAWPMLRAVAHRGRPVQMPAQDPVSLAMQALVILQRERASRGLEPIDCARIDISYGEFDEMRIQFGAPTLADGADEGMQRMGELCNFEMTPKIARSVARARAQAQVKSGMRD